MRHVLLLVSAFFLVWSVPLCHTMLPGCPARPRVASSAEWNDWLYATALLTEDRPARALRSDATTAVGRLREIGVDVPRFLRGLFHELEDPGFSRPEVEIGLLASLMSQPELKVEMVKFLQSELHRPLSPASGRRAEHTLRLLGRPGGYPPPAWTDVVDRWWFQRMRPLLQGAIGPTSAVVRTLRSGGPLASC